MYSVYILVDDANRIIVVDSDLYKKDFDGWIKIDEGDDEKYALAQTEYFEGGAFTKEGVPRYSYIDGSPTLRSDEDIQTDIQNLPAPVGVDPNLSERVEVLEEEVKNIIDPQTEALNILGVSGNE